MLTLIKIFGAALVFIGAFSEGMDYGFRWLLIIAGAVICGLCLAHSNRNKPEKRVFRY